MAADDPARVENYTTTVSAGKTASEIQALLAAHGVQRLMLEYADGKPTGVAFQMETEFGSRLFQLPVNVDAMHQLLIREKRAKRLPGISETLDNSREHAERVVAEWLRAQLTLVATRMASLDQVMLPYLVQDGRSLYDAYREQARSAIES